MAKNKILKETFNSCTKQVLSSLKPHGWNKNPMCSPLLIKANSSHNQCFLCVLCFQIFSTSEEGGRRWAWGYTTRMIIVLLSTTQNILARGIISHTIMREHESVSRKYFKLVKFMTVIIENVSGGSYVKGATTPCSPPLVCLCSKSPTHDDRQS